MCDNEYACAYVGACKYLHTIMYMYISTCICTYTVFCPHWSALVGNNHLSDKLTTS